MIARTFRYGDPPFDARERERERERRRGGMSDALAGRGRIQSMANSGRSVFFGGDMSFRV